MDERAQEKLHKESLKGIIDSITLKKREANGLHQVHNPILNAEKMLFDDRETRWNGKVVEGCQQKKLYAIQRNGGLDHWIANFRSGY